MISAYIFFTVKLGKTDDVVKQLREIPQVTRVAVVTGTWDIVARIAVSDLKELYEITTKVIHLIEGIEETQTAVIETELINE